MVKKSYGPSPEELNNLSDHDLLIRLHEQVIEIRKIQENHLEHHRSATMLCLGALLAAMLAFGGQVYWSIANHIAGRY